MGQVNRVDSVKLAIERMQKFFPNVKDPVLVSDAFFPFPDSVELIAKAGIRWIVQPGGSVKDDEVLQKAQELNVQMLLTKTRHFKH
jgi:phosphoribosylaminoimidazolecarboxamide formyltransferase/IMP cyclohydrolase